VVHVPKGPFAEATDRTSDLGDPEPVLRDLAPEVRTIASYLWARSDRRLPEGGDLRLPAVASLQILVAAVEAVREAIADTGTRGLPPEKIRALHERLDRAFARLVAELLQRGRKRSAEQLRDISHDLRSPLNSILLLVDALSNQLSGELNDVQRRQVGVLYTAALSLIEWLTDLIDASTMDDLDEIPVLAEPFSVQAVLNRADQLLGALAAHSGIELAFGLETDDPRAGDRRIFARVLVNLVSNAIHATPRGGSVRVRVWEPRPGRLSIEVEDSGTEADVVRLRKSLSMTESPASSTEERSWTRGIGLSICARLVAAVGGSIDVEGGGGQPCRFILELPFGRA